MKRLICLLFAIMALTVSARAAELPRELTGALPEGAAELLEGVDPSDARGFSGGVERILEKMGERVGDVLRQRVRGAASVLLVVVLCGAVDGFGQGAGGGKTAVFLPMAGALSVTLLTAGSLDSLIGLGAETIGELNVFSKALLPTLAAATAASGAVTTATFQQVATVFLAEVLMELIDGLLMPLVYLYIGVLTAGACLPENRLAPIADGLKKLVTWMLTTALLLFTVYLSVARVITGAADGATVKVAKAAISGVVPVVGGIIAEASETVLAGAGLLKSTIGVFGMLAILAACAYPFLQLGVQYLLYKLTAFLAGAVGAPGLCKLIDGLGGAFGLVLGMTGSCAVLLLVSVLSSVAAVTP
nr:stage III sporulation protein AE [uncultured Oscillibacter sp.]